MSTFYGKSGFPDGTYTLLPSSRSFDPRTGEKRVDRYKMIPAAAALWYGTLKAAGYRCELEVEDGGFQVVAVTYGYDESTQDKSKPLAEKWELVPNMLEKSLWTLPEVATQLAKITTSADIFRLTQLRRRIDLFVRGEQVDIAPVFDPSKGTSSTVETAVSYDSLIELVRNFDCGLDSNPGGVFTNLIRSLANGEESKQISQFVLQHEITTFLSGTIQASYANTGRMYATESLKAIENIPGTVKFQMPPGFWLKQAPHVREDGYDRWLITQEWWHADDYNRFLYGTPL